MQNPWEYIPDFFVGIISSPKFNGTVTGEDTF